MIQKKLPYYSISILLLLADRRHTLCFLIRQKIGFHTLCTLINNQTVHCQENWFNNLPSICLFHDPTCTSSRRTAAAVPTLDQQQVDSSSTTTIINSHKKQKYCSEESSLVFTSCSCSPTPCTERPSLPIPPSTLPLWIIFEVAVEQISSHTITIWFSNSKSPPPSRVVQPNLPVTVLHYQK